ncbi:hypothetical protein [Roseibacillus persicicus]|uniref:Uncharacterized protein n=1 Tax=Roseibacillus persicicus TaxID=454148 RepID=A0A918TDY5_9BACT|nr:hypothetical protein [Roseibacillus persicicus]GHC41361.1 hypothetical protein GCM10007100_02610 [Roseibacillus persicicus]
MKNHIWSLLPLLVFSPVLQGRDVEWRSLPFQTNVTSSGQALDDSWSFSLGYFAGNFVPSDSNTEQWAEHWVTLDVSRYVESQSRFVGVWSDTGEVPDGKHGYIWGLNRGALSPEWILLGGNSWTFPLPFASPIDPDASITWTTDTADNIVVGQVGAAGAHITTAAVAGAPYLLEGEVWRSLKFVDSELENPLVSGWETDPDGDGFSNLEEFAFGLEPLSPDAPRICPSTANGFFEFEVTKAENVAVGYLGEVSDNLTSWADDGASVALIAETATSLVFRDLTALGITPRFGRVQVTLLTP